MNSTTTTIPFRIDLEGKVAVVTGGGGVLCVGLCVGARRERREGRRPGFERRCRRKATAKRLRDEGGRAIGIAANALERASLETAAETVARELGPCDLLLNGAGGNHPKGTTTKEWLEPSDVADAVV